MKFDPGENRYWAPKTNIFVSNSGELIISVDLSGLRSGDIDVTVEGKRLRIRGVRHVPDAANCRQLLANEIPSGPFENVLEVQEGFDVMAACSTYLNGILRIVIPSSRRPQA